MRNSPLPGPTAHLSPTSYPAGAPSHPSHIAVMVESAGFFHGLGRHSTIKLYLAAVRNLHITAGFNDPLKGTLLLCKVLCVILRYQGQQRIRRQPVTRQVLLAIHPILQSHIASVPYWAAFNLAFFAFPRCSKFTYLGVRKYRPLFDLTTDCIAFHPSLARPQVMSVQLKSSKTDIFRQGQSLIIHM